jgi:hypothetical protein
MKSAGRGLVRRSDPAIGWQPGAAWMGHTQLSEFDATEHC